MTGKPRATSARTVLLADDDPQILTMISQRLRRRGYEVIEAENGTRALEQARATHPDVIVLDVLMPGMSGWEVARALRHDADLKEIPIIVLTAIGRTTNEATSPLFADEYLDKPFEFTELEKKLALVLKQAKP
ncbi:MAG TPA: response regulator [Polyangia bacterium]|jgi:DNA-binding response OmpR family regulator